MATQSKYTKTYTSFGGADIIATFNGKVMGELSAITYSVTREKAPVYVMGDPNPKSFSRGKRGIAGSLTFQVFDRDALHVLKTKDNPVYRQALNTSLDDVRGVHEYGNISQDKVAQRWSKAEIPKYSDEIPPFDITINFLNEYGQSSQMTIYGVEILNEGMGMSVDDITTEKACTFVARSIEEMKSDVFENR
ncbi:tail tube protein [Bacillus phage vB_BauM_KLEB27-3]|nr:tail tube protein [Bacillus phage vB_BauM_KLEB27-3]